MEKLLTILLILSQQCFATTYYVKADGIDGNTGLSDNQAWGSISKINGFTFAANDSILFKRNGVWTETLRPSRNNLYFDAYGTGAKPLISGLTTLSGWTSAGSGIYTVTNSSIIDDLHSVSLNGRLQEIGRFPNSDTSYWGGYLPSTAFTSNTQVTVPNLGYIDWSTGTGADLVSRLRGYIVEVTHITAKSGNVYTYAQNRSTINPRNASTPAPTTPPATGTGHFVQNDVRTLDKFGEWYFNPSTNLFSIYTGATNASSYTIQASFIDTLMNIGTKTNISVNNIDFEGANTFGVFFNDGSNITITNCKFTNIGATGIMGWYSFNTRIESDTCINNLRTAIDVRGPADPTVITKCIVTNTAMYKGMSSFYDPADGHGIFIGVSSGGSNNRVSLNKIDSVGYMGIHWEGNNVNIDSNYVGYFGATRNDGGAIYAFNNYTSGSNVRYNIVNDGRDATAGTQEINGTHGIYMDGGQGGVTITDNSISNLSGPDGSTWGLFSNSPKSIWMRNNTVYNSPGGWYVGRQYSQTMSAYTNRKNTYYSTATNQVAMQFTHDGMNTALANTVASIGEALAEIGSVDSNYYNLRNSTPFSWYYATTNGGGFTFPSPVNFAGWKSASTLETNSTSAANTSQTYQYNATNSPVTYTHYGYSKIEPNGTVTNGSTVIPAWGSKVLIANGTCSCGAPGGGTNIIRWRKFRS